jgi:hypothetical protein
MDIRALRDHANEMLTVIAADLETPQGQLAQSEKSKGQARVTEPEQPTAAGEHGAGRAQSGFTVEQMVAEYQALRASVIRLWTSELGALEARDVEDLTRFNEAVDQALAESVARFDRGVEQAKETSSPSSGTTCGRPSGRSTRWQRSCSTQASCRSPTARSPPELPPAQSAPSAWSVTCWTSRAAASAEGFPSPALR